MPNSARSRRILVGKSESSAEDSVEDVLLAEDSSHRLDSSRASALGYISGDHDPLGTHSFAWRDFFDVAVKWRQLGEPFDTVLWIDCTAAQEDKHDKVGLQTFIHHGVGKNIRYYPYFDQTFALMKKLLPNGCE